MSKEVAKDVNSGQCLETSCKANPQRLNFCKEHFAQFKAGVIKKNGLKAKDYEKKLVHYELNKAIYA